MRQLQSRESIRLCTPGKKHEDHYDPITHEGERLCDILEWARVDYVLVPKEGIPMILSGTKEYFGIDGAFGYLRDSGNRAAGRCHDVRPDRRPSFRPSRICSLYRTVEECDKDPAKPDSSYG